MSSGLSPHPQASHATPSSTANLLPQPSIASLNDSPSKANPFSNAKGAGTSGGGGGGSGLTPLPFQGTSPPFASSPNALRTPSNLNSNAAAMDLLSKARLAAGLNHGSSSPFTNQQAQALLFGQTPMPSTSALLVPPPSSSSSNHSRARLIEQECEEFERAVAALEALAEGFYNQLDDAASDQTDSQNVQAALQALTANLEQLLAWTAQTTLGGLPIQENDAQTPDTPLSDRLPSLSGEGSQLYDRLRGIRDGSGIVSSVLSGGRGR